MQLVIGRVPGLPERKDHPVLIFMGNSHPVQTIPRTDLSFPPSTQEIPVLSLPGDRLRDTAPPLPGGERPRRMEILSFPDPPEDEQRRTERLFYVYFPILLYAGEKGV